jgi:2-polyprenyl-6-hydroxyphenyl methylase/3-demethylubiquinone-9 3-methyltransferase
MLRNGVNHNIDPREIERFEKQAEDWWDLKGPLKALHDINPLRIRFIRERSGIAGKTFVDAGCGGGILSEALAAAGGVVTGIDMADSALQAARRHMRTRNLQIEYRRTTVEALAHEAPNRFDVATCMELLEHVPRPASVLRACADLVKPGGDVFLATVNRTWTAYALVILVAENILKIVRKGTHTYKNLIRPTELASWAAQAGLLPKDLAGYLYIPFFGNAYLSRFTKMNYLMHLHKPE